jgi:hypothetical protein
MGRNDAGQELTGTGTPKDRHVYEATLVVTVRATSQEEADFKAQRAVDTMQWHIDNMGYGGVDVNMNIGELRGEQIPRPEGQRDLKASSDVSERG